MTFDSQQLQINSIHLSSIRLSTFICTAILLTVRLPYTHHHFAHSLVLPFHRQPDLRCLETMQRIAARTLRAHAPSATSTLRRWHATQVATTTIPAPPGNGPVARRLIALDENTIRPFIQTNAHVAPSATVIGSVTVNDKTAILDGATLRGDLGLLQIGAHCVVGEGATVIATGERANATGAVSAKDAVATGLPMTCDASVGDYSRVGAGAVLSSCELEGENDIGAGAVIKLNAVLGRGAQVAPRSVVEEDVQIPEAQLWAGNPAVFVRSLLKEEVAMHTKAITDSYAVTRRHMYEFLPVGTAFWEKERIARESNTEQKTTA